MNFNRNAVVANPSATKPGKSIPNIFLVLLVFAQKLKVFHNLTVIAAADGTDKDFQQYSRLCESHHLHRRHLLSADRFAQPEELAAARRESDSILIVRGHDRRS